MPEKDVQLVVYTEQISVIFNNEYIPVVISKNSDYTFPHKGNSGISIP